MTSSYIYLGNRYIPTKKLRSDTNRKDWDIKNDPEIYFERLCYENRVHLEDKGMCSLILSTKNSIIE